MPRLCEFYPGICLATEEKARKNLSQGMKNLSQVKKNLSPSRVYILPKHPQITKPIEKISKTEYNCERYIKQILLMKGAVEYRGKIT